ncbi:MAG: hypothetical protein J6O03_08840 [Butyrivibrio sp.]|nr:hypothetical protein [Butyrivibrio sp.]MBP3824687.1 hypothetical protein [Butyrivibrio sp.]
MEGTGENTNITVNGNAEMLKVDKKHLFWQRLSALAVVATFLVVLVVAMILVPQVLATLDNINRVAKDAESAVANVDTMVLEMTDASKNLNQLVGDNSEALNEAITNMANVDYDGLNKAIKDLQDTVGPMASFFSKFR